VSRREIDPGSTSDDRIMKGRIGIGLSALLLLRLTVAVLPATTRHAIFSTDYFPTFDIFRLILAFVNIVHTLKAIRPVSGSV